MAVLGSARCRPEADDERADEFDVHLFADRAERTGEVRPTRSNSRRSVPGYQRTNDSTLSPQGRDELFREF
jgi:hypothetical protein